MLHQPRFGKLPTGDRLERIKKSPNYKNGSFQNQRPTPVLTGPGLKDHLTEKRIRVSPLDEIPSLKTDLIHLGEDSDVLVWFGHSSYFIQIDHRKILVDPVLSGHASPFSFAIKAFRGTDRYTAADIPEIDYLIITHDHWDHLDYKTLLALKPKIRRVICGLGVGAHFERWGYGKDMITEMDWDEQFVHDSGFIANALPARHFSGRTLRRNKTLWTSFVLQTPTMNMFIGGDGGYDNHFAEIGDAFGPLDLAILENGQYNKNWKYIHLLPDEILKTFNDLKARRLFTVHHAKFALAGHPWDEPLIKVQALKNEYNIPLITPMIGEQVNLKDSLQPFSQWWKHIN